MSAGAAAAAVPQIAKAANLWTEWNDTHVRAQKLQPQKRLTQSARAETVTIFMSMDVTAGGLLPGTQLCCQHF